jgi:DNA-binding NtrC family response regulator
MLPLPKILVIDDQWGHARNGCNKERVNFCLTVGVKDVTGEPGKVATEPVQEPVVEAVFCSGQVERNEEVFNDVDVVLKAIRGYWSGVNRWALVLLDMCFITGRLDEKGNPQGRPEDREPKRYFGLEIIEAIKNADDLVDLPVIPLSSMESLPIAQNYGKLAKRFCDKKDVSSREMLQYLIETEGLIRSDKIIGASFSMIKIQKEARTIARSNLRTVLIQGERGTGKELLARYFHDSSPRKNMPYITVNCNALQKDIIASELFGYEKGAFTGANARKKGIFELADKGTVFLDEIGTMPYEAQLKLLRVIEYGTFMRVGGPDVLTVDVCVVAATNTVLKSAVERGDFSYDLFDRIRGNSPLYLPPLRERLDDIPLLAEYFVQKSVSENNAMHRTITKGALDALYSYFWPGNVRELEHVLSEATIKWDNAYLLPEHLKLPRETSIATNFQQGEYSRQSSKKADDISIQDKIPFETQPQITIFTQIEELLSRLSSIDFSKIPLKELTGKLEYLKNSCNIFLANYLKIPLEVTITSAIKMAKGSNAITANEAADEIKRILLNLNPNNDPILKEALNRALSIRPKNPQKKKNDIPDTKI